MRERKCLCGYRDVVACAEKPVADEVKAGYSGAEVNPVRFREKVNPGEQFFSNVVISILQVGLGLSQGATQHTLGKWVTHTLSEKMHTNKHNKIHSIQS